MEDVEHALRGIDDSKSTRLDGFNSFFFEKVWHIVKYDIFDVVSDFFGNDVFFSPINP